MSRIGKLPINIPKTMAIAVKNNSLEIRGSYGIAHQRLPNTLTVELNKETLVICQKDKTRDTRKKQGLIRALVKNIIFGLDNKFEQKLQMVGIGYRAHIEEKKLILNVGYSQPIALSIPNNIDIRIESNNILTITGINKEQVGLFTAKIRSIRPPEPYKGKGIRYINEKIFLKPGKSMKNK